MSLLEISLGGVKVAPLLAYTTSVSTGSASRVPNQTTTAASTITSAPAERLESPSHTGSSPGARAFVVPIFAVAALAAINLGCFYRTLTGYFVADDFIHVTYLAKVFAGHPELLLQNFVSNWMQAHGTQFYRPLVSLSLALDYWVGGGNATIFHITNLCLQIASAIFLYLLTRRLLHDHSSYRWRESAAFTAAGLFSAYPLHAEVVSWVIGRVDSLCAMFYLGAFWLFLKARQDRSRIAMGGSLLFFVLGLLSKEMAVTLPATLALYCLFEGNNRTPLKRIESAFKQTWIFWSLLAGYFVVRVMALGTIMGGYSGAIGESLGNSFVKRWFQDGSLRRILIPLNVELFAPGDKTARWLIGTYGAAALLLAGRALIWKTNCGLSRYFFFAIAWFVLAMVPAYNVWNLTENLQGSRFIYLGSAPLCLALALLLIPLFGRLTRWRTYFSYAGIACAAALLALCIKVAYKDNLSWAHAFTHMRDFREALAQRVSAMPPDRKLVILNVPQKQEGAHMLYNASMLGILLEPPLTQPDISRRVISFEPMTYGFPDLIAPTRLRSMGADRSGKYEFVSWDTRTHSLQPLSVSEKSRTPLAVDVATLNAGLQEPGQFGKTAKLISPQLNLPATGYDILRVRMKVAKPAYAAGKTPPRLYLFWNSERSVAFSDAHMLSLPVVADGAPHDYVFHVSERKSWLASNTIDRIQLELPFLSGQNRLLGPEPTVSIEAIVFEPASAPDIVPSTTNLRFDDDGVYRNTGWPITLSVRNFEGASTKGDKSVLIELSKESAWFEHYTGTYRDDKPSANAHRSFKLKAGAGQALVLDRDAIPCTGYYQLRAFSLDDNGAAQGYASDPINLQLTK